MAVTVRSCATDELTTLELRAIRALLDAAFEGDFSDEDMAHGLGGMHFVAEADGRVVAHASVVGRRLYVDGKPFEVGYVEAVATEPAHQRRGHGTAVMGPATEHIRAAYELGALGTGEHAFYERLGWERWRGQTFVRLEDGTIERTPDEDDGIMVLRHDRSATIDLTASLTCEWRPGDVW